MVDIQGVPGLFLCCINPVHEKSIFSPVNVLYICVLYKIKMSFSSIADIRYTNVQETKENEAALAEVKYVSDDIQIKRLTEIEKTAGCEYLI